MKVKTLLVEKQEKIEVLVVHSAEEVREVPVEAVQGEAVEGDLTVEGEVVDPVEGMVEEEGEEEGEEREGVGGLLVLVPVPRGTGHIRWEHLLTIKPCDSPTVHLNNLFS